MLKQSLEKSTKTDTKDLDQGASAKTSSEEGRGGRADLQQGQAQRTWACTTRQAQRTWACTTPEYTQGAHAGGAQSQGTSACGNY
eukprot:15560438-Heterocapsa_arctica.AAC.1